MIQRTQIPMQLNKIPSWTTHQVNFYNEINNSEMVLI